MDRQHHRHTLTEQWGAWRICGMLTAWCLTPLDCKSMMAKMAHHVTHAPRNGLPQTCQWAYGDDHHLAWRRPASPSLPGLCAAACALLRHVQYVLCFANKALPLPLPHSRHTPQVGTHALPRRAHEATPCTLARLWPFPHHSCVHSGLSVWVEPSTHILLRAAAEAPSRAQCLRYTPL